MLVQLLQLQPELLEQMRGGHKALLNELERRNKRQELDVRHTLSLMTKSLRYLPLESMTVQFVKFIFVSGSDNRTATCSERSSVDAVAREVQECTGEGGEGQLRQQCTSHNHELREPEVTRSRGRLIIDKYTCTFTVT